MKEFYEKQQELDNIFLAKLCERSGKSITHEQLFEKNSLALFTEIAEFAKEHEPSAKRKEYIDILHYLLCLGNTLGINKDIKKLAFNNIYMIAEPGIYLEDLVYLVKETGNFLNSHQGFKYWKVKREPKRSLEKNYINTLMAFFNLGKTMDYSAAEIVSCYKEKYQENIQRQKDNY